MGRLIVTLLAGLVTGAILMLAAQRLGVVGERAPERDIVDVTPMGHAEAARHRNSDFAELQTIEALQALPSEFDRGEALYVISGRSNLADLQKLAFDAARIAEPVWRERALSIVFFRLTEVDPKSAMVLVRTDYFAGTRNLEKRVWRTWARMDLPGALDAARALDDTQGDAAAQMIYSALGGAYTAEAQVVEQALGIPPSSRNRVLYLRDLFDLSPADALSHVLSLEIEDHRNEQIEAIAELLAARNLVEAEKFADLIDDPDLRRRYLGTVYDRLARENPQQAFEKRFANRNEGALSKAEIAGFKTLASTDLNRALRLLSTVTGLDNRVQLAGIAAVQYAKEDPAGALKWARAESEHEAGSLVQEVLLSIATQDPALALREAQSIEDARDRSFLTMKVVDEVLKSSPEAAAAQVGNIRNEFSRRRAAERIARKWLQVDASAAVSWVLGSDPEIQEEVFSSAYTVADIDLDEAQVIVASLPARYRGDWVRGITNRLVNDRSPTEAMQFVSQFAGDPGFDLQMAQLVSNVARSDSSLAARWAERIPPGVARDAALSNVIARESRSNPTVAAQLLERIDDPDLRYVAAGDIAERWLMIEPDNAAQWLDAMPRGVDRDNVVLNTAMRMSGDSDEQLRLIETIDDPETRQQAMFVRAVQASEDDPDELMRLMDEMGLPAVFRQEIKSQILRSAASGD